MIGSIMAARTVVASYTDVTGQSLLTSDMIAECF